MVEERVEQADEEFLVRLRAEQFLESEIGVGRGKIQRLGQSLMISTSVSLNAS